MRENTTTKCSWDLTWSYFSSMANACVHLTPQATSLLSSSATERKPKNMNTRDVARAYTSRQIAAAYCRGAKVTTRKKLAHWIVSLNDVDKHQKKAGLDTHSTTAGILS